jgi:hypothetical protein
MVLASRCRGPLGCRRENNLAYCDESIGLADDPCDAEGAACSADGRHVLDCTGGRFVARHAVDTCDIEGDIVRWTGPYATVGEPCSGEGSVACSDDGRMLSCRDRQLAPYLPCRGPRRCYAEGDFNRCDQSIAAAGDACAGSYAACSQDHTAQLRCRDGAFVHEQRCADCTVRGGAVHCRPFIPRPHR